MLKPLILAASLTVASVALAADEPVEVRALEEGAASPPARIDDFAWLAGHWRGPGLGGTAEEVIAPAAGGHMMGMFRLRNAEGVVQFYEFYTLAETGDTVTLRLKHFTPELAGWEEKADFVEFRLVALEEGAAYFDGLTFEREGKDGLNAAVNIGSRGIEVLRLKRVKE
jgi:hypothetical protein